MSKNHVSNGLGPLQRTLRMTSGLPAFFSPIQTQVLPTSNLPSFIWDASAATRIFRISSLTAALRPATSMAASTLFRTAGLVMARFRAAKSLNGPIRLRGPPSQVAWR